MTSLRTVLVVEDNLINRMMLEEILASQYHVLEAENGQLALDILEELKGEVSLILLDVNMPVMDGYTFLARIKANPAFSSIPVIITTQSDSESDEVTALSNGAADFVAKPYKPQIILHRVANIIHLRETAAIINLVERDRLTGLYSKEFFYQRVKETLSQNPEKEYDIICSDIVNFKFVNDIFGIPAGDALLCRVADLYTSFVKNKGICGRFNADQFACLVERQFEYTDALFIKADTEVNAASNVKSVMIKWGVYHIIDRAVTVEQMCDRALLAARSIKGQYSKHFATYDNELRDRLLKEQAITDGMEPALADGQFKVYLQPKYRIIDNTLAGAEALVRWIHPELGFQSPAQFIPLFERNGFITRLDQYVWNQSCAIVQDWDKKGYAPISVSVNVSRADIYNVDIVETLQGIVKKYDLPPARLHLEITESAYTEKPEQIIETVGRLRELGFIIELDDFGSGYSSLNMLHDMQVDILKLDMKFIQSETAKPVSQGILRFIMALARWMDLNVVAEGVETKEQLERLREIGCDYVQGYYFAKPMPVEEFEQLVKECSKGVDCLEENHGQEEIRRKVLLIADEEEACRAEVKKTFSNFFQVIEAADCQTALKYVDEYKNSLSVMILSLTLDNNNGMSVLKVLQEERKIWNIPIITTAAPNRQLEEEALGLGAADFIGKPYSPKGLWKRIIHTMDTSLFEERERAMKDEAYRDYLTGLYNRRGFYSVVRQLMIEDAPLAVYLFDLDNLKEINDIAGYHEGDKLIMHFAEMLRSQTRGTNIAARFGGDEFVVIMKQMQPGAALKKGESICEAVRDAHFLDNLSVSCSAGVAVWDARLPVNDIIERASQALFRAKKRERGTCSLWEKNLPSQ